MARGGVGDDRLRGNTLHPSANCVVHGMLGNCDHSDLASLGSAERVAVSYRPDLAPGADYAD